MSMTDRGNGGQHVCLFCTCKRNLL